MKALILALSTLSSLVFSTSRAHADYFEHGNWATVKIGQVCYVYSLRSAKDTSGTLIFGFLEKGYNASFEYRYTPTRGRAVRPGIRRIMSSCPLMAASPGLVMK